MGARKWSNPIVKQPPKSNIIVKHHSQTTPQVKHQSNTSQTPVKAPVKAQSKHQSNTGQTPVKHRSKPANPAATCVSTSHTSGPKSTATRPVCRSQRCHPHAFYRQLCRPNRSPGAIARCGWGRGRASHTAEPMAGLHDKAVLSMKRQYYSGKGYACVKVLSIRANQRIQSTHRPAVDPQTLHPEHTAPPRNRRSSTPPPVCHVARGDAMPATTAPWDLQG